MGHIEFVFSSKGRWLDVNEICNGDGTPAKISVAHSLLREVDLIVKINLESPVSTKSN